MSSTCFRRWVLSVLVVFSASVARGEANLSKMFGDNMVLQRGASTPVWGRADAGESVTLTLADQTVHATADKDGIWQATFQNLKPARSLTLTVTGKNNTRILKNVAVGDLWVCSGQSNMAYRVGDFTYLQATRDEIATANYPDIRYFDVRPKGTVNPVPDVEGHWVAASPATVRDFSAVGYYFGKNLHKELGIPIGVIRCAWSGTSIEPWIRLDMFRSVPDLIPKVDEAVRKLRNLPTDIERFPDLYKQWQEKYGRSDPGNKGFAAGWADPNFAAQDWTPTTTPGNWVTLGMPNGGVVWIRKTVKLPVAGKGFNLKVGLAQDLDTVYFNGEQVGVGNWTPPYFWLQDQYVPIPGRLVKAGDNVIAIRILCQKGRNEAFGLGDRLDLPVANPRTVSNEWLAKVETAFPALPPGGMASLPQPSRIRPEWVPSTLFNGMVYPLTRMAVKGAIWYQGESNSGNPWAYRTLLPLLIQGWRAQWNNDDLPFYIVQLPAFGKSPQTPGEGDQQWAELREAQLMTWQKVPHTGMAVTMDVGDPNNLHPANKQDVGYRLALAALADSYGRSIEYSGPVYKSMAVEGNTIRLKFTHVGEGLVAKAGPLKQFVIAGVDKKWSWGNAVIDGETVVVSSPDVPKPVAVRYAWANNPEGCNLFNKAGLPASTFRTDDWPLKTQGRW